jgi:D-arabinose 1-dehydrogenase-like Zn-dependent alcohol dehydrogenase
MKAAQISKAGGDWEIVERQIPQPDVGQVRVRVEACGVCHSDMFVKEGLGFSIRACLAMRSRGELMLLASVSLDGKTVSA